MAQPDPAYYRQHGLLAEPDQPWEHLQPSKNGERKRPSVSVPKVDIHPEFEVQYHARKNATQERNNKRNGKGAGNRA